MVQGVRGWHYRRVQPGAVVAGVARSPALRKLLARPAHARPGYSLRQTTYRPRGDSPPSVSIQPCFA
jgi:hypothetical protein